jgi:hypothetical protein
MTLLTRPALYVALLIEGGTCWSAANNATLNGRSTTASTAPLRHDIGNSSLIEVRLAPPGEGEWTQHVGLYSETVLLISIALLCSGANGSSHVVTLKVPAPGPPQALSGEVRSVTTAGQWMSLAGQSGSSGAIARVAASRTLQLCGGGDLSGLIVIPTSCHDNGGSAGNLVAAVCGLAVAVVLCSIVALVSSQGTPSTTPFVDAMRQLAFPSCLVPLLVAILPSTASMSVVQLVAATRSAGCGGVNGALGVLGLLYCFAVVAGALCVFLWTRGHMEAHKVQQGAQPTIPLLRVVNVMMARRFRWSHTDPTCANTTDRHVALVLQEYRLVWFFGLDAAVLVVSGVLVGVAQASSETAVCAGCGAAIAMMYLVEGVTCVAQRPFTTLFGHVYCVVSIVLSAVSVGLQTANLLLQWGGSTDYDTLRRLGAAACDLCVMGISFLRLVFDLMLLVRFLHRLALCPGQLSHNSNVHLSAISMEIHLGRGQHGDPQLQRLFGQRRRRGRTPTVLSCC